MANYTFESGKDNNGEELQVVAEFSSAAELATACAAVEGCTAFTTDGRLRGPSSDSLVDWQGGDSACSGIYIRDEPPTTESVAGACRRCPVGRWMDGPGPEGSIKREFPLAFCCRWAAVNGSGAMFSLCVAYCAPPRRHLAPPPPCLCSQPGWRGCRPAVRGAHPGQLHILPGNGRCCGAAGRRHAGCVAAGCS